MNRKIAILVLLVMLGSCRLLRAKVSGQVFGIVEGSETPTPVMMAAVKIVDKNGNTVATAFTGMDGRFTIEGTVPFGTYKIVISDPQRFSGFPDYTEKLVIRKGYVRKTYTIKLKPPPR